MAYLFYITPVAGARLEDGGQKRQQERRRVGDQAKTEESWARVVNGGLLTVGFLMYFEGGASGICWDWLWIEREKERSQG